MLTYSGCSVGRPHQTFSLNAAELERKYRALQFQLHPDKAASKSNVCLTRCHPHSSV